MKITAVLFMLILSGSAFAEQKQPAAAAGTCTVLDDNGFYAGKVVGLEILDDNDFHAGRISGASILDANDFYAGKTVGSTILDANGFRAGRLDGHSIIDANGFNAGTFANCTPAQANAAALLLVLEHHVMIP